MVWSCRIPPISRASSPYRNASRILTAHPPQTSVKNTSSSGTLNLLGLLFQQTGPKRLNESWPTEHPRR